MTITALATVREVIPGTWAHATPFQDIADPASFQEFMGPIQHVRHLVNTQGMQRAQNQMNAGLWAVLQHTRATQVVYRFAHMPTEEWAQRANAIFLVGEKLTNIDGEDLLEPANQHSVPYHPDARMRASRIRADLGVAGINVLDDLPPVRSEHELVLRSPREVARRICALIAISEIASYWYNNNESLAEPLFNVLPDALPALTPHERALLDRIEAGERTEDTLFQAMQLSWSSKAAHPLAFALAAMDVAKHMRGRAEPQPADLAFADDGDIISLVAELGSVEFIARYDRFVDNAQLCDFYEYVRSLRWVAVDETLRPEDPHHIDDRTFSVLMEWHKALAWLTDPAAEWDHVSIDT